MCLFRLRTAKSFLSLYFIERYVKNTYICIFLCHLYAILLRNKKKFRNKTKNVDNICMYMFLFLFKSKAISIKTYKIKKTYTWFCLNSFRFWFMKQWEVEMLIYDFIFHLLYSFWRLENVWLDYKKIVIYHQIFWFLRIIF